MTKSMEMLNLFEGYVKIAQENERTFANIPNYEAVTPQNAQNAPVIDPDALDATNDTRVPKPVSNPNCAIDEVSAKAKLAYITRKAWHRYLKRKPGASIFRDSPIKPDDSLTESVADRILRGFHESRNRRHIMKNDRYLDSIKDNFLPPSSKSKKLSEEELEEMKLRHKLALGATTMATLLGAGKAQANETPHAQPDTLHSIAYQKPGSTKYDYKYVSGHEGDSIVNAERGKGNNVIHTRHITYPKSGKSDVGFKGLATRGRVVAGKQFLGNPMAHNSATQGLDIDKQLRTNANNPNAQTQFSNADREYHRWTK